MITIGCSNELKRSPVYLIIFSLSLSDILISLFVNTFTNIGMIFFYHYLWIVFIVNAMNKNHGILTLNVQEIQRFSRLVSDNGTRVPGIGIDTKWTLTLGWRYRPAPRSLDRHLMITACVSRCRKSNTNTDH